MRDQITGFAVFAFALCLLIYFAREAWRAIISPEFKRDMEWLRENRRRRRTARRRS